MNAVADYLSTLPWEVVFAFTLLGIATAGAGISLLVMFHRSVVEGHERNHVELRSQPWLSREDDGEVYSIPLYPPPPEHITRWGIHRAHVMAGEKTERGCPVCYTLELHSGPRKHYTDPFSREKES